MAKKERITTRNGMVHVPFTQMPDHILEDSRLSGNAYRMLNYIMSKQQDKWEFYRQDIEKRLGIGKFAYYAARDLLYKYGYLEFTADNQGTDFVYFERPDKNPYYVRGINKNGERKVEYCDLLAEIMEKEKALSDLLDRAEKQAQSKSANDYQDNSIKKKNVNQKNKKIGNYQDNVGNYEHDDDLFFEE